MFVACALVGTISGAALAATIPTLEWSTYYGGKEPAGTIGDEILGVSAGDRVVMVAGSTNSKNGLGTPHAFQKNPGGENDAFLARFDSEGMRLWSTYFGGDNSDFGTDVATDPVIDISYLVGVTFSDDSIATPSAHQPLRAGQQDGFVAKFDGTGHRLWSTYYGGTSFDRISAAKVDPWGDLYICGQTQSSSRIATADGHKTTLTSSLSSFLAKFDSTGQLLWGTYYGGGNCSAIAVDEASDAVYITGFVAPNTDDGDIATAGAHQEPPGGGFDAYLARFDAEGTRVWGTYYGGEGFDSGESLAVDCRGLVYLAGNTSSLTGISTPGAHQEQRDPNSGDGFLVKFRPSGQRIWGTYYGGNEGDEATSVATSHCDDRPAVYLAGATSSADLATPDAPQPTLAGESDGYLVKFTSDGIREWATYHGSTDEEFVAEIDSAADGLIYMGGRTQSPTGLATPGALQTKLRGAEDGFLAQFSG